MAGERQLPGLGLFGFWALGSNGYKPQLDANLRTLSVVTQGSALDIIPFTPALAADGDVYILDDPGEPNHADLVVRDNAEWVYITPRTGWLFWVAADSAHYVFDGTAWVVLETGGGGGATGLPTPSAADALKVLRLDAAGAAYELVTYLPLPTPAGVPDATRQIRVNASGAGYELFTPATGAAFTADVKTANYVTVSADFTTGKKLVRMNLATANTLTVAAGMGLAETLAVSQMGAGQTTITAGAGVVLLSADGALRLRAQHSTATLMRVAADTYLVSGDLTV